MASPRSDSDSTPICRCRVLYLGSAVPHVTKDGLQGIQEPLRELYPEQGALGARGIDSWLSVWSNGLLLENVDENHKKVTRFFPIDSLHYCAAVRYVLVPEKTGGGPATPRFLPLDSPFARSPNPSHPPLFAAILRRTTGIKVLECHTFICKREMAANALVRCCFHAYADSSYVKHIDNGGTSVYGTLRSHGQPAGIDKVEEWRVGAPSNGSTLTLNNHHHHHNNHHNNINNSNMGTLQGSTASTSHHNGTVNSTDDISIYNGDENHKVWAGSSTVDRDEIYGGSTMRSARSTRPRQVVSPASAPPPPPPAQKEEKTGKKLTKERNRRKKMMGGSREELYPLMNGSLMRGGGGGGGMSGGGRPHSAMSGSLQHHYSNGTMMRPASSTPHHPHPHHLQHHPAPPPPQMNGYHPSAPIVFIPTQQHPGATTLPHKQGKKGKKLLMGAGTFSHRPKSAAMMVRPPPPPQMVPVPYMQMPPHQAATLMKRQSRGGPPPTAEEPIYMPSARPMSPIASFQPGHFPHEAYLLQQHAGTSHRKNKSAGKQDGPKMMMVVAGGGPKKHHHHNNNHHHNHQAEDEQELLDDSLPVEESPFNTGIYRKKGHLNERAFSYSIRQEHRSRSYGSLANLKFASPPADVAASREDLKKEREIAQMVQDLELSGDGLERSEVPAGVYESRRTAVGVRR